jgi:hypothetical protein
MGMALEDVDKQNINDARKSGVLVRMIDSQGWRRSVETCFMARDSSWREILRGGSLRGGRGFVERTSPWSEPPHGENFSVKNTSP